MNTTIQTLQSEVIEKLRNAIKTNNIDLINALTNTLQTLNNLQVPQSNP